MGKILAEANVKNLNNGSKSKNLEFLVDTGSTYIVLPKNVIEELELKIHGKRELEIADGRKEEFEWGGCEIEYDGLSGICEFIVGLEGSRALLGYIFLETLGLEPDPKNQILKRGELPII